MLDPSPAPTTADHAGVKLPPPLLYAAGLGVGLLLQARLPLTSWSQSLGILLALPCLALGVVLCGWAIVLFRRFRTSLVPIVPSAALVTRGPYRFTRNPMYVGLGSLIRRDRAVVRAELGPAPPAGSSDQRLLLGHRSGRAVFGAEVRGGVRTLQSGGSPLALNL